MTPVTGSGGSSESRSFWQNRHWALAQWNNLCSSCAWLTKSLRAEWSHPKCLHCLESALQDVALLKFKVTDLSKPASLRAAATSHSFGRLNKNAPLCSKVLICINVLQLCVFYLSLIHLAS